MTEGPEDFDGIIVKGSETFVFVCPICSSEKAVINQRLLQIPYYDDFHAVMIICPDCGLRRTDFANINSKGPKKYEYLVSSLDDFSTKVVRSIEGSVLIPEIGVEIKPATAPSSWIRNVEGILNDISEKITIAKNNAETPDIRVAAQERLRLIEEIKLGEIPITLIVSDPSGNSVIIPENPEKLVITDLPNNEIEQPN